MLNAPKKCAKCEKQVYTIEELKCLDKIWHRNCFKCTVCNSVLNMKTYKGFDKQPYCFVHYPQQKHTVISDNPEMQRIKENTKIQSNAKYHEDFEKMKGNYTSVADDPETRRVLENTKIISQAKYHEDFEKNIKNKYTPVIDSETTRAIENQKTLSSVEYKGTKNNHNSSASMSTQSLNQTNNNNNIITQIPNGTLIATYRGGEKKLVEQANAAQTRKIGSIADYDPFTFEKNLNGSNSNISNGRHYATLPNQSKFQQPPQINYANGNSLYSINSFEANRNSNNNGLTQQQQVSYQQQQQQQQQFDEIKTSVYRAIYDYDAKEDDEISFRDSDRFTNCEQIDVGWMIGVHEKTGKHGMFPSNYAEPVDLF